MGWGDEILATGEARLAQEADPERRRVVICDRHGRPRWHPLWEGNPRLVRPTEAHEGHLRVINGSRARPYVDYAQMKVEFAKKFPLQKFNTGIRDARLPWRFTNHRCTRGEIHCVERLAPRGYVVVEPHYKPIQTNRDWGWDRWQAVVDAVDADWVQINPRNMRQLRGTRCTPAGTFLDACRLLSGAALYVGPEGGLYHAAAAFNIPSVAIFGGYVSPANQGYDDCINLYEPEGSPCGQRVPCTHCKKAMARLTVEMVIGHVERMLSRTAGCAAQAI